MVKWWCGDGRFGQVRNQSFGAQNYFLIVRRPGVSLSVQLIATHTITIHTHFNRQWLRREWRKSPFFCTWRMKSSNKFDESPIVMIWQNKNVAPATRWHYHHHNVTNWTVLKKVNCVLFNVKRVKPKIIVAFNANVRMKLILVIRTSAAAKMAEKMKKNENRFWYSSFIL